MSIARKLVTTALLAGSFLAVGVSDAFADCSSAASCTRQLACSPGAEVVKVGSDKGYCKQTYSADSKTPICEGKGIAKKNWVWDPVYTDSSMNNKKGMCVTKDNKGAVSDTNKDAITCSSSSYTFNNNSRKCEQPASVSLHLPKLATGAVVPTPPMSCASASACTRQIKCNGSGYNRVASGAGFYCTKTDGGAAQTPKCEGKGPFPKNWVWDAVYTDSSMNNKKGMCVTKDNKGGVSDTNKDAITCNSGYTFNNNSRKCEKPGGTYFDTPVLGS